MEASATKQGPRQLLRGQRALVTGGNSGIGRGVALALAEAGADVVVNYVSNPDSAASAVAEIQKLGRKALAIRTDVSDESQVEAMFKQAIGELGTLDILVANAGLQRDSPIDTMSLADWKLVLDVNLTGQFLCARAAVREFKRRGVVESVSRAAGKIICMSSVHDTIAWAEHANYAASKGGIMMMMKTLAQELAPHHIRVNSICPGAIRTSINRSAWETPQAYQSLMKLVPWGRIGEADDIGKAAVWLASDEADYVTGLSMYIDGGMMLYPGFSTGG
jgi:glucose 1-dehydrogenase